jgi:hypothetical protein
LKKNAEFWCIGQFKKKRSFGKPRRRWEDNSKYDLRETECEDGNLTKLAQGRVQL